MCGVGDRTPLSQSPGLRAGWSRDPFAQPWVWILALPPVCLVAAKKFRHHTVLCLSAPGCDAAPAARVREADQGWGLCPGVCDQTAGPYGWCVCGPRGAHSQSRGICPQVSPQRVAGGPRSDAHEGVSCLCLCRRGGRAPLLRVPSWASMGVAACSALLCDDSWCLQTLPRVPGGRAPA